MTKLTKKIVAIVTTVTCAVWMMGPGVANAVTAAELQALINSLLAQIADLQTQLAGLEGGGTVAGCTITSFDRNLKLGMSGDDVKCLQIVLNTASDTQLAASGVGSSGNETLYFGPLTQAAVIKFQEKYASEVLASWGLTSGTGYVGSTTRDKLNSMLVTGDGTTPVIPTTGAPTISLAADTPDAAQVALNAQDTILTKIRVTGGSSGVTITKVIVKRGGVSADADVSAIKLYDGTTQLGSSQALNTNTHKASFSGLSWSVPAGSTKYLTIKANIAASGTATVGDSVKLGIETASDITSDVTLSGTYPIYGNARTVAGISVGYLTVDIQSSPATNTSMLSGSTEQEIAAWKFTASSTEGFDVHSIKVTHVGSATRDDVSNIKLKISGTQIGATVAQLDSQNAATFDLSSAPIHINASASKTVYAYADVAAGIWTARTIIFEITQYTDVVAYGANSGGAVTITKYNGQSDAYTRQTGNTMTVGQGALTVTVDAAENPAGQTYVKGTENRLVSAFKFSAGSTEGVRIAELKLYYPGTATDISNVTLWDGSAQIAGPASVIGSYVTFGSHTIGWDTSGLFDIAKSGTKTILVKADVPSGAATNGSIELYINSTSDVYADGLSSMYDIASGSITVSGAGSSYTNAHTISANGTLTVSVSANTPAAQTYIKGSTEQELLRIDLSADSGEDMLVSSITFTSYYDSDVTGDTETSSGTLTNVKVLKMDGTQFGSTIASPVSTAAVSGSLTIPAAGTVTLKVIADIPATTSATSSGIIIKLDEVADITTTGVSSGVDISESGTFAVSGNSIAIGEGSLNISAAATPGDQTVIIGATEVPIVGLVFTAGSAEDIKVTKIKLTASSKDDTTTGYGDQGNLSNVALWDGTTRLTVKKGWDTSAATTVDFTSSNFLSGGGITITKGQQKTITVKADLPSTGDSGDYIALGIASSTDSTSGATATTADVVFVGLSSNTSPATQLSFPDIGGPNFTTNGDSQVNYVYLASSGTLTAAANADTPETAIVSVGSAGTNDVAFLKIDYKASREDVLIKTIEIKRSYLNTDVAFGSISLWDGSTQLGYDQTLVNRGIANSSTTFTFTVADYWRIPAGVTKTLTVKADLNGVKTADQTGVTSGDAARFCLASTTAMGASSGVLVQPEGATEICGNALIFYQSKPTLAAASLPSTVLGAGEKVLYRWTVTADSKGDIGWSKIVFDISGSITYHGANCTIGKHGDDASSTDGIVYVGTSTDDTETSVGISYITNLDVFNVATGDEVTASSTGDTMAGQNPDVYNYYTGGARVAFIPDAEQVVAAGTTKTYELRGDLGISPTAGDAISVKINKRATATTTAVFDTVALSGGSHNWMATGTATFVWTDRSGVGTTHDFWGDADWSWDYKVSGLPTATLSLSR